jgi:hypothetical protein
VYWRPRASEQSLRRAGKLWTLSTVAHTVPFIGVAGLLVVLNPITLPVALVALAHAWIIPELYAARGANVARALRKPAQGSDRGADRDPGAEAEQVPDRVALGLLGDLLDHEPRALHARTGLVAERGELGVWLVGPVGALLVRHGGRRVHCYCVKASGTALPAADRIAHLLLALRTDEAGFATVANLAFSGARWRVRRRLPKVARPALSAAAVAAGTADHGPSARRSCNLRRRRFGRRRTDPA